MSEHSFVSSLLGIDIRFPWKGAGQVCLATELKITKNKVDIVYYERINDEKVGSMIAVEAKLKDWRKAIQQSYRNRLFADRAYVALPERFATSAVANLAEFRRASVGLIVLGEEDAHVYYHPPLNTGRSQYHVETARRALQSTFPICGDAETANRSIPQGVEWSLALAA